MSNLSTGSVDVVRERERQARQQLLEEIREPSPQPIFGEPIKVDPSREDATSRQIRNTLGDFNQVQHFLINDPKHLIGISRSAPPSVNSDHGNTNSTAVRQQPNVVPSSSLSQQLSIPSRGPTNDKRPLLLNGMHKSSGAAHSGISKLSHSSSSSSFSNKSNSDKKLPVKPRLEPSKTSNTTVAVIIDVSSGRQQKERHREKDKDRERDKDKSRERDKGKEKNASRDKNKDSGREREKVCTSESLPNIVVSSNNSANNSLTFSSGNGTGSKSSPSSIVQNGSLPNGLIHQQRSGASVKRPLEKRTLPKLTIPEQTEQNESQLELENILREMKQAVPPPLTAIQTPKTEESGFPFPSDSRGDLPAGPTEEQTSHRTIVPSPAQPQSASKTVPSSPFNLQEDLEMSDSGDDLVLTVKKPPDPGTAPQSPINNISNPPSFLPVPSSSSDSSCSDSEDSSSESNDSDSSASSEGSDHETPTMPAPQDWRLSKFLDETRRNHSPAFITLDTNTNTSTAIKDETLSITVLETDTSFSLADEDSVNGILGKYSNHDINKYLQSSMPGLLDLETDPADIKIEVMSPLPSPTSAAPSHSSLRGPRTPPLPPDSDDDPRQAKPTLKKKDKSRTEQHKWSQLKQEPKVRSEPKISSCELENGRLKIRLGKVKSSNSPRTKESSEINRTDLTVNKEPSASKNPIKVNAEIIRSVATATTTTICTVPSVTTTTMHGTPDKSHRKHTSSSSSLKKIKSHSDLKCKEKVEIDFTPKLPSSPKVQSISIKQEQILKSGSSSRASSVSRSESSLQLDITPKSEITIKVERKDRDIISVPEKTKDLHVHKSSGHESKLSTKKSLKIKPKLEKHSSASSDNKKPEKKSKAAKKFCIQNFVQSPSANSETEKDILSQNLLTPKMATPERISTPEMKKEPNEGLKKKSIISSPSLKSRSPNRPSSKHKEKVKDSKKVSSSSVVDVINSVARGDMYAYHRDDSKTSLKSNSLVLPSSKRTEIPSDLHIDVPVHVVPPELLSPIPQDSPIVPEQSESAIPSVLVSIALSLIDRVPSSSIFNKASKEKPVLLLEDKVSSTECKNISSSTERLTIQPSSDKPSLSEDVRVKHRTDPSNMRTNKENSVKKEKCKIFKHHSDTADNKNEIPSTLSDKSGIKNRTDMMPKSVLSEKEGSPLPKKRKIEEEKDRSYVKKKPKIPSKHIQTIAEKEHKEQSQQLSIEPVAALHAEARSTPKPLERCDSASSLSSFSSQQSHKSSKVSKEKQRERFKDGQETKRFKSSWSSQTSLKENKREKVEKQKIHDKREANTNSNVWEKDKSKSRDKVSEKDSTSNDSRKYHEFVWEDGNIASSQGSNWEETNKIEETKVQPTNHQRQGIPENHTREVGKEREPYDAPDLQQEHRPTSKHSNKQYSSDYFLGEGKKLKHQADKEQDQIIQGMKYLEAVLFFILTGSHMERNNKELENVYRMYKETLNFSHFVNATIHKIQNSSSASGSIDNKLLILSLRCQSLLYLKLYNLRRNEVKEHQRGVSDFMKQSTSSRLSSHSSPVPASSSSHSRSMSQPSPCQPRIGGAGGVPSPHSPTPSPAGSVASVGSQSSGYSSSELNGNHSRPHSALQLPHTPQHGVVSVPQNVFDMMQRQHSHLNNLHMCHELWEQADMLVTRGHSKEFFKEVAEKCEQLTLHSSVEDLVNYVRHGLSQLKESSH